MNCNCNAKYDNKVRCCCTTRPAVIRVTTTTTTTIAPPTTTTTTLPCICIKLIYNKRKGVFDPPVHAYTYKNCNNGLTTGTILFGQSVMFCGKKITSLSTNYFCDIFDLGPCSAACTMNTTTTAFPFPTGSTTTTTTRIPGTSTTTSTTTISNVPVSFSIKFVCENNAGKVTIDNFTGGSGSYQISNPSYVYSSANAAFYGFFINGSAPYNYTGVGEGIRWFAVRDTYNPTNISVSYVNVQGCYITPTTSTTTTAARITTTTSTTTTTTKNPNTIEIINNAIIGNDSNKNRPFILKVMQTYSNNPVNPINWDIIWDDGSITGTKTLTFVLPGNSAKGTYSAVANGDIVLYISNTGDGSIPTYGYDPYFGIYAWYWAHVYINNQEVCCVKINPNFTSNQYISTRTKVSAGEALKIILNQNDQCSQCP
jgi:hypothetical protein